MTRVFFATRDPLQVTVQGQRYPRNVKPETSNYHPGGTSSPPASHVYLSAAGMDRTAAAAPRSRNRTRRPPRPMSGAERVGSTRPPPVVGGGRRANTLLHRRVVLAAAPSAGWHPCQGSTMERITLLSARLPVAPEPGGAAAADPLTIGSTAPELKINTWVKGDPVAGIEKGKMYVVEFWGTACGPCIKCMPHLSNLQ